MKKNVLILIYNGGEGHLSHAEGVERAINNLGRDTNVEIFQPYPDKASKTYEILSTQYPFLWKIVYWIGETKIGAKIFSFWSNVQVLEKIERKINEMKPDLVVSNYFGTSIAMDVINKKRTIPIPLVVHFGDAFTIINLAKECKSAEAYLVYGQEARQQLIRMGIPNDKIHEVGAPVRNKFHQKLAENNREQLAYALSLDSTKRWIFIGGAGQGIKILGALLEALRENKDKLKDHYEFIVNTGFNVKSTTKALNLQRREPNYLTVLPYIKNTSKIMQEAEILIGKAGPNFIMEAIKKYKPLVLIEFVPGQEEGNLDFTKRTGISNLYSINETIELLINNIANPVEINKQAYEKINDRNDKSIELIGNVLSKYI